jgi:hypothetical protein
MILFISNLLINKMNNINYLVKKCPIQIYWCDYDSDEENKLNYYLKKCKENVYLEYITLTLKTQKKYFKKIELDKKLKLKIIHKIQNIIILNKKRILFILTKFNLYIQNKKKYFLVINKLKLILNLNQKRRLYILNNFKNNLKNNLKNNINNKLISYIKDKNELIFFQNKEVINLVLIINKILELIENKYKLNSKNKGKNQHISFIQIYKNIELIESNFDNLLYFNNYHILNLISMIIKKIKIKNQNLKNYLDKIKNIIFRYNLLINKFYEIIKKIQQFYPNLQIIENELLYNIQDLTFKKNKQEIYNYLYFKKLKELFNIKKEDLILNNEILEINYIKFLNN